MERDCKVNLLFMLHCDNPATATSKVRKLKKKINRKKFFFLDHLFVLTIIGVNLMEGLCVQKAFLCKPH